MNKVKSSFSISAGFKDGKDEYKYNNISTANLNKSRLYRALAICNHEINNKIDFTSGT